MNIFARRLIKKAHKPLKYTKHMMMPMPPPKPDNEPNLAQPMVRKDKPPKKKY